MAQEINSVIGVVVNSSNGEPLENVNIVNLNQVKGTATNNEGTFQIVAKVNDTLHLSYLGFKSIKVRETNDWLKFGSSKIELTELALALEEVVVNQLKLTGYLEVDIKQVPIINNNYRYSISGLSSGYEAGKSSAITKIIGSIFNPADVVILALVGKSTDVLLAGHRYYTEIGMLALLDFRHQPNPRDRASARDGV
jgi:hypothetical protein